MTYRSLLQQRVKKNLRTKALQKFGPHGIILGPIFTEKSYKYQEKYNVFTCKVHTAATKNDIKHAIRYLYNIQPVKVNIIRVPAKYRVQRNLVRCSYKKAIVMLSKNDKIEIA